MRHVRMLGLCLAAVLAVGAYAVSSASALEWGKCAAKAGGKYSDANCTVKAHPSGSGSHEWLKASEVAAKRVSEGKSANVPFAGHNVGSGGVLSTSGLICEPESELVPRWKCLENGGTVVDNEGLSVECTAETNTGEAVAKSNVGNVNVTFTGCTVFGSAPCESTGAASGEIKTSTLKGKLGYINKTAKEVGVLLEPAAHHGHFALFTCAGVVETTVGVGSKKVGAFYVKGTNYPSGCGGYVLEQRPKKKSMAGMTASVADHAGQHNDRRIRTGVQHESQRDSTSEHPEQLRRQTHRVARRGYRQRHTARSLRGHHVDRCE